MPSDESNLVYCYNRGCGKKYDPANNSDDACRFHAGVPFFHDAYKGWTCCNKKCIDFTEFLNIPGCTLAKHSNVKPIEPPKPIQEEAEAPEVVEVKPIVNTTIERPDFNSPMITTKPILTPSIKQQMNAPDSTVKEVKNDFDEWIIKIGMPCQNSGCKVTYEGPSTDATACIYHPGTPIFHEGLKFWSCCQKRTSDFQAFLNQEGCARGMHEWHKKVANEAIECRWDWHQTGNDVVISIYAKEYCPTRSVIKLNPVRVYVDLLFPKQNNSIFNMDIETRGVIDLDNSQVTMFGTKVEIKLRKAHLNKWEKLDIPREVQPAAKKETSRVEIITPQVDAIDLDDL